MNEAALTKLIDHIVEVKITAMDRWIEEHIDDLEAFGNPEKLSGKPYETWTPQDLMMLGQVYGPTNDTALARLIARKEIEKTRAAEKALLGGI